MTYILLAVVGLSVGILFPSSLIPRTRVVPLIASVVVVFASIYFVSLIPGIDSNGSTLFGLSGLAGALLAPGFLWKDHPMLRDLGYFDRLKFASHNFKRLRETQNEQLPD
ncbi:hypothetical protein BHE16_03505 [Neomicrococcus aestuarii]|uniref:Uncharacterized protein n=1 Tax=Neomicrococcus aestuarii TaxID=556325 RepID=A0A1L2ZM08_9MICC|nr:hypothetical protein BHE16_03505 [Neomicrococcus aestuarii]